MYKQIFKNEKVTLKLKVNENYTIQCLHKNTNEAFKFGQSIHYCNLKINGVSINHFISLINPKLFFVNMGAVDQKLPGPISSDIYYFIESKLA